MAETISLSVMLPSSLHVEHRRDTFSRLEFSPSLDEVDVLLLDLADTSEENGFVLYHDDPDNISR